MIKGLGAVIIRSALAADEPDVRLVQTEAFGDGGHVASLAEALRRRPDTSASLVAEVDAAVIGHVQLSVSWVDAPDHLLEVLVLSPLGVRPAHPVGLR
ncbi:MAG: GNAT family N-acetyltransferase [Jatrophihabitans sp.]